jgi:hypothetical protein
MRAFMQQWGAICEMLGTNDVDYQPRNLNVSLLKWHKYTSQDGIGGMMHGDITSNEE